MAVESQKFACRFKVGFVASLGNILSYLCLSAFAEPFTEWWCREWSSSSLAEVSVIPFQDKVEDLVWFCHCSNGSIVVLLRWQVFYVARNCPWSVCICCVECVVSSQYLILGNRKCRPRVSLAFDKDTWNQPSRLERWCDSDFGRSMEDLPDFMDQGNLPSSSAEAFGVVRVVLPELHSWVVVVVDFCVGCCIDNTSSIEVKIKVLYIDRNAVIIHLQSSTGSSLAVGGFLKGLNIIKFGIQFSVFYSLLSTPRFLRRWAAVLASMRHLVQAVGLELQVEWTNRLEFELKCRLVV